MMAAYPGLPRGRVPFGRVEPKRARPLGPEYNPWYWNPNRIGAVAAPAWFAEQVEREFGPDIRVVFNPVNERWQVFARSPRSQNPLCAGWRLLFIHNGPSGQRLPLNEILLARLESIDMQKQGGATRYFDRIQAELARDKAIREKDQFQETMDIAMERGWDHSRISTAGRGNKFTTYHS